jgi:gliding motility associated protien GldN
MKKLIFSLWIFASAFALNAQGDVRGPIANPAPGVLDGVYVKEHIPTKKVIPYEFVREADVTWSKRVWRIVDLREKFNHPLYYPLDIIDPDAPATSEWKKNSTRWSLWTIIRYHIMNGDLTIYSTNDPDWFRWDDGDQFKYPYTADKFGSSSNGTYLTDSLFRENIKSSNFLGSEKIGELIAIESIQYPGEDSVDANYETVYYPSDFNWIQTADIIQYKIKEDWFFDKETSKMEVRILGIAPVVYAKDENGNITGTKDLFWLYFPECRYVFQNFFVQSRNNDSQRMSFDDLFWKRMFTSYIEKESNIYDRDIDTYKAGVNSLLEAEKIKNKIFVFEHDLWSF